MPETARSRPAKPRPPARDEAPAPPPQGPRWARAVHAFYDPIFDIRSRAAFQAALNDFVLLPADERAFHQTHLLYRMVQGLESLHGVLARIEEKLDAMGTADLSALEHLEPIRAALEEIASSQPSLLSVEGWEGGLDEADEPDEEPADEPDEDGDGTPDGEDPDYIYEPIPDEAPEAPRRARRPAAAARPPREPRAEPPRPEPPPAPRPVDPEREALVGDLVPANEGPRARDEAAR